MQYYIGIIKPYKARPGTKRAERFQYIEDGMSVDDYVELMGHTQARRDLRTLIYHESIQILVQ